MRTEEEEAARKARKKEAEQKNIDKIRAEGKSAYTLSLNELLVNISLTT